MQNTQKQQRERLAAHNNITIYIEYPFEKSLSAVKGSKHFPEKFINRTQSWKRKRKFFADKVSKTSEQRTKMFCRLGDLSHLNYVIIGNFELNFSFIIIIRYSYCAPERIIHATNIVCSQSFPIPFLLAVLCMINFVLGCKFNVRREGQIILQKKYHRFHNSRSIHSNNSYASHNLVPKTTHSSTNTTE